MVSLPNIKIGSLCNEPVAMACSLARISKQATIRQVPQAFPIRLI